jgi:hypothetical protein
MIGVRRLKRTHVRPSLSGIPLACFVFSAAILSVVSCTTMPEPSSSSDTLVIIPVSFHTDADIGWIAMYRFDFNGLREPIYIRPSPSSYRCFSGLPVGRYVLHRVTQIPSSEGAFISGSSAVTITPPFECVIDCRAGAVTMANFLFEADLVTVREGNWRRYSQSGSFLKIGTADLGAVIRALKSQSNFARWQNALESSTIPVSTILWKEDGGGFIQLKSNDPSILKRFFIMSSVATQHSMTTVNVTAKKLSGAATEGFGVVFCHLDNKNHYRVLITTTGYYCVEKMVGGILGKVRDWSLSPNIKRGFGSENTIIVSYNGANSFAVFFNGAGNADATFEVPGGFFGGAAGFCVSIGDSTNEDPLKVPVDVRFKMTSPFAIPGVVDAAQ